MGEGAAERLFEDAGEAAGDDGWIVAEDAAAPRAQHQPLVAEVAGQREEASDAAQEGILDLLLRLDDVPRVLDVYLRVRGGRGGDPARPGILEEVPCVITEDRYVGSVDEPVLVEVVRSATGAMGGVHLSSLETGVEGRRVGEGFLLGHAPVLESAARIARGGEVEGENLMTPVVRQALGRFERCLCRHLEMGRHGLPAHALPCVDAVAGRELTRVLDRLGDRVADDDHVAARGAVPSACTDVEGVRGDATPIGAIHFGSPGEGDESDAV